VGPAALGAAGEASGGSESETVGSVRPCQVALFGKSPLNEIQNGGLTWFNHQLESGFHGI